LGIIFHFVPAGWDDELQRFHHYFFGALKAVYRRLSATHCDAAEGIAIRRFDAVQFPLETWDLLEVSVIEKGWGVPEDETGDLADNDDDDPLWEEQ
jgi:hypothetical protein